MPTYSHQARASIGVQLRRIPEQTRSWRKVESVLSAAERILEAHGYDALVANPAALFADAGISSGTFYDYFESLDAVVECVRLLWTSRIGEIIDRAYATPCRSVAEVVDRLIDANVAFFENRSARDLWLTHHLTPSARQAELLANQTTGARVRWEIERLGYRFLGDGLDELVLVEIADQLSRFAILVAGGERPDEGVVDRARRATLAYVERTIQPTSGRGAGDPGATGRPEAPR
ncbi:TetR/AcrR family transcriptional regulator [Microbacterium sp. RD1]|uniref:TetR/AcrR family transcriptional regulator n=1 Tax=Microbacterium sp. RD1 TaxID=3457313 RepID=UPI003FA56DE5